MRDFPENRYWDHCAPDYLDGEEKDRERDEEERQRIEDDHVEEMIERRRGN